MMNEKVASSATHRQGGKQNVLQEGKEYIKKLGPGIVSGAADDDPSGIATYSQAGAQYGTGLLWLSAWIFPFVSTVQEMCARIALVTGRGLASNIKHAYPKYILYFCTFLLFFANTLNIGADLGAMAKAVQLLIPQSSFAFWVVFMGLLVLILEILIPYRQYAKYLKWLVITLLAYVATGFIIDMHWPSLLKSLIIPHITFAKDQILLITGVLGTTISPYLFFWETSQEVEEQIAEGKTTAHSRRGTNKDEIKKMRFDVFFGMFFSNLVMFFIIAVCANTLFVNGITNIETASDAALALKPLAGNFAFLLFALGIIGTGLLGIPTLAGSASYAISESFSWKEGLYRKFNKARAFYGVIAIAIVLGILMNFVGIDPIKALIYSAIANGIVAPIVLIFIVHISGSKKIMGHYKNSLLANIIGWVTIAFMSLAAIGTLIYFF